MCTCVSLRKNIENKRKQIKYSASILTCKLYVLRASFFQRLEYSNLNISFESSSLKKLGSSYALVYLCIISSLSSKTWLFKEVLWWVLNCVVKSLKSESLVLWLELFWLWDMPLSLRLNVYVVCLVPWRRVFWLRKYYCNNNNITVNSQ